MAEITKKKMDAAIRKASESILAGTSPSSVVWDRAIYIQGRLDGMRAAAEIKDVVRDVPSYSNVSKAMDYGHDRHRQAIRAAIRRLKRELKNAD